MKVQDRYINHLIKFFETICFNDINMGDQIYRKDTLSSINLNLSVIASDLLKKDKAINTLCHILKDNKVEFVYNSQYEIAIDITSLFNVAWQDLNIYKSFQSIKKYNL